MTPNDLDAIRAKLSREDADDLLRMAERDVPALCDEVAALRAERDRALAELKAVDARWQCSLAGNMAFVIRAAEAEERAEALRARVAELEGDAKALGLVVREDALRPEGAPRWTAAVQGVARGDAHTRRDSVLRLRLQLRSDARNAEDGGAKVGCALNERDEARALARARGDALKAARTAEGMARQEASRMARLLEWAYADAAGAKAERDAGYRERDQAQAARESLAVSLGQAVVRADREEKARRILEEHVATCEPGTRGDGAALARAQAALRGES